MIGCEDHPWNKFQDQEHLNEDLDRDLPSWCILFEGWMGDQGCMLLDLVHQLFARDIFLQIRRKVCRLLQKYSLDHSCQGLERLLVDLMIHAASWSMKVPKDL